MFLHIFLRLSFNDQSPREIYILIVVTNLDTLNSKITIRISIHKCRNKFLESWIMGIGEQIVIGKFLNTGEKSDTSEILDY